MLIILSLSCPVAIIVQEFMMTHRVSNGFSIYCVISSAVRKRLLPLSLKAISELKRMVCDGDSFFYFNFLFRFRQTPDLT